MLHERIEGRLPLMEPALTRDRYIVVLQGFHAYYAALEPRIHAVPSLALHLPDHEQRRKLARLDADLGVLGAEIPPPAPAHRVPTVCSVDDALGALYVLEGATLGGQLIARHLRARLALDAGSGAAFFGNAGEPVGPAWRRFGDAVERWGGEGASPAAMIDAASATFRTLDDWLQDVLAVRR